MKKTEKIRAALAGGAKLTRPELEEVCGQFNNSILSGMVRSTELIAEGSPRKYVYRLNSDYRKARRLGPPLRRRRSTKRSGRAPRAVRPTARANGRDLHAAALRNFIAAGEQLRAAIREQVEEFESDVLLAGALLAHETAQELLEAAQ